MGYSLPLFLGFLTASFGITPPGLINMTAAKVSLSEGRTRAMIFACGATIVVLAQTFIGVIFAEFIDKNPQIVIMLREAGLGVFALLTVYFFFFAKKPNVDKEEVRLHSKRSRFFMGMLLSALNFFPIPFYVFISVTLASYHYFEFRLPFIYTFVFGSGLGAFFGFYCYIAFFKKMQSKTTFILKNMNYIIGSITGLVSIITLVNIILYYFS
ncbi:MAG: lysine transporter LysE [Flavobacterium sp. BFFFF1]|uniref:LysE family transporter n=1 Tax=Flavobacterium sp. BFFFF1 TaxID=2015557 RepID=UPI000BD07964|nr:LysE family transporter [Flavobacterium sp. BFFFF1]OYU81073.1 MAG: lysine transporter LysE [Flavobacterium sp. BFFFF1]